MNSEPTGIGTNKRIEVGPKRIKASELKETDKVLHINGIIYAPNPSFDFKAKEELGKSLENQTWFLELTNDPNFKSGRENIMADIRNEVRVAYEEMDSERLQEMKKYGSYYVELVDRLIDQYLQYKYHNKGKDPEWLSELDPETRKYLAFQSVTSNLDDFPPHLRSSPLTYAGINSFALENEELYNDLLETFNLWRLTRIKQLAYKHDPVPPQADPNERFLNTEFSHTRYGHSFDVLAIANLLGTNAQLSKEDLQILQIAAVSHDFRTPAGGDTTKMIDPEFFDEDKHYNEIFTTEKWQLFASKYGISKEKETKLYETIQGKGILGKLLDFADKLGYIARDIDKYLEPNLRVTAFQDKDGQQRLTEEENSGFKAIRDIAKANPLVCGVWDSAEVIKENIVITDARKLSTFLKMRALLWKEVYYNPYARFFIDKFVEKIIEHLYKSGQVTKEYFLTADDSDLDMEIDKLVGSELFFAESKNTIVKEFTSTEEARAFASSFQNDPKRIAIVDDWKVMTSSSTKKFLVKKDGNILPFDEAYPQQAQEINEIVNSANQIHVYVLHLDDFRIPPSHREKIKKIFEISE